MTLSLVHYEPSWHGTMSFVLAHRSGDYWNSVELLAWAREIILLEQESDRHCAETEF